MAQLIGLRDRFPASLGLSGGEPPFGREQTLRRNQQRLLEAIELDPSNQHAVDSLRSLREVAAALGISLPAR
jgi:hypothetical protein